MIMNKKTLLFSLAFLCCLSGCTEKQTTSVNTVPTTIATPIPTATVINPTEVPIVTLTTEPVITTEPIIEPEVTVEPTIEPIESSEIPDVTLEPEPTPIVEVTVTPTPVPTATNIPTPKATNTPTPIPEGAIVDAKGNIITNENAKDYQDEAGFLKTVLNPTSEFKKGNDKLLFSCSKNLTISDNYYISFETLCQDGRGSFNWYYLSIDSNNPEILDIYISGNGDNYNANEYYHLNNLIQYSAQLVPLKNGKTTLTCTLYNKDTNKVYDTKKIDVTVTGFKERTEPYVLKTTKIGDNIECKFYNNGYLYIDGKGKTWDYDIYFDVTEGYRNKYILSQELADSVTHIIVSGNITHFDLDSLFGINNVEYVEFPKSLNSLNKFSCDKVGFLMPLNGIVKYYNNNEVIEKINERDNGYNRGIESILTDGGHL